jgi:ABC-2 type transport system permease protein
MNAIFKRELKAFFFSPVAYVLIGLFILLSSFGFRQNLLQGYGGFNSNLNFMGILLVFIIPILTMRLLAEDKKNGTEVLLITSPVNLTSIVLGKYLAALIVFLVMTAATFVYPIILLACGAPLTAQLLGGYVGFILLGAAFLSVGIFASSLTENQVISAVVGFVCLLLMYLFDLGTSFGGVISKVLGWLSLFTRYETINSGVFDISSIVYFLSFIGIFLFLTVRVKDRKRWSQG